MLASRLSATLALVAAFGAAAGALSLTGCTDSLTGSSQGTAQVHMTDSPADFQAVTVVITKVELHRAGAAITEGWVTLASDSSAYELLRLRNGVFATIGDRAVPAGHYTQLRLTLGGGSSLVLAGVPLALTLSDEARAGVIVDGSWDVKAGQTLDLGLDFDAGRSIVLTGTGSFRLAPVVRCVAMDESGAIAGTLTAGGGTTTVTALQGAAVVASAETMADGRFTLSVLPAGAYTLVAHAATAGFRDSTMTGVNVRAGATTSIGVCALASTR